VVVAGETVIDVPVPIEVPPQLPAYHFHEAPSPRDPLTMLRVVLLPRQMVLVPLKELAGIEESSTVTVIFLQIVLLQVPSARRK
jgi:hypothetical protein